MASANAQVGSSIVAVVNDDIITQHEVDQRLRLLVRASGDVDIERARQQLTAQVLRQLIDERLQVQEADRLGIRVAPADVETGIASIAERNGLTVDQLFDQVGEVGVEPETLRQQIRAQIAWVGVINTQLVNRVNVTPAQIEMVRQETIVNDYAPEYQLGEILLPIYERGDEPEVAREAASLVNALRGGTDFEALAGQLSVSQSAAQGGDIGWRSMQQIPPIVRPILEDMQPGEVADPVRLPEGFYIFKLYDVRAANREPVRMPNSMQIRLSQVLFPFSADMSEAQARQLVAEAENLRPRLSDCPTINRVADDMQAPASGDIGWLRLGDLPDGLRQPVSLLDVGEVSPPLIGPGGIHVLMVCERRGRMPPPPPEPEPEIAPDTPEVRAQIRAQLETQQIERLASRYLRDLRQDAFIDIRL